jgi:hypothetical protein
MNVHIIDSNSVMKEYLIQQPPAPRLENPESDEKDAPFGLHT